MKVVDEINAKIDAIKAKANADMVAIQAQAQTRIDALRVILNSGSDLLQMETDVFKAKADQLISLLRG